MQTILHVILDCIVFVVVWGVLRVFSHTLIDYEELIKWIEKKFEFIQIIKKGVRDSLLKQGWQILLAFAVAVLLFDHTLHFPSKLTTRFFPQAPQFLYIPKPNRDMVGLRMHELPMVGHNRELEDLKEFLNAQEHFLWWWLNGKAGSGKRRLTFEWLHSLPKACLPHIMHGYDAGFFREVTSESSWRSWKPRCPTVIVIDNAVESADVVLTLLGALSQRAFDFRYPVRVLLVEESIPQSLKRLDEEMHYSRYRYRSKPLYVSPLGPTHLQKFVQYLSVKHGKPLNLTPQAEQHIMEVSQGRDDSGSQ